MAGLSPAPSRDLRCASLVRGEGHAPVGTAGYNPGYLLVDWPLPWPEDIGAVPELEAVHDLAAPLGVRVQAVVPSTADGDHHVVLHRSDGPGFAGYRRSARAVRSGEVVDAALAMLSSWDAAGAPPDRRSPARPGDASAPHLGDVLVCAHGRRDPCCGRDGTLLAAELLVDPALRAAGYRVGRTSHTGGHRFAPTAIVLPQGTMWAFLDAGLVRAVVERRGPVEAVLPSFRGSTGLGSPVLQALEQHAFGAVGWDWVDWRRHGRDAGEGRVALDAVSPTGERASWEAAFGTTPRPVPDCGKPLADARKHHDEPVLLDVRRTA